MTQTLNEKLSIILAVAWWAIIVAALTGEIGRTPEPSEFAWGDAVFLLLVLLTTCHATSILAKWLKGEEL